jgi:hypothetical protein
VRLDRDVDVSGVDPGGHLDGSAIDGHQAGVACVQVVGRRPLRVRDLKEVVLSVHQGCACTGGLIHGGLVWSHLAGSA